MKLYDETIERMEALFTSFPVTRLKTDETLWPEVSDRSMILRSDMAYELGSGVLPGFGCTLITTDASLVGESSISLCGENLDSIHEDSPYARISIVKVNGEMIGEGDALYSAIRKLEYVRYHHYPEGFMMRVSSSKNKESVRVGKEALKKGLSFSSTGSLLIDAFKKNPVVEEVKVIYVTRPDFNYKALETLSLDAEDITKAIDHIFKNVQMDCNVCSLQKVCEEVEGLRELHFAQGARKNETN